MCWALLLWACLYADISVQLMPSTTAPHRAAVWLSCFFQVWGAKSTRSSQGVTTEFTADILFFKDMVATCPLCIAYVCLTLDVSVVSSQDCIKKGCRCHWGLSGSTCMNESLSMAEWKVGDWLGNSIMPTVSLIHCCSQEVLKQPSEINVYCSVRLHCLNLMHYPVWNSS